MAKEKEQSLEEKLQDSFNRWKHLYENGGSDPFWSDGCNLGLVRNHILYYKGKIEEEHPDGIYPDIYYKDTPPEVDKNYMAKADFIKEKAEKHLIKFKNDSNYNFLLFQVDKISEKLKKEISIDNIIGYVKHLERAISDNDLVSMRRSSGDYPFTAFKECADKINCFQVQEIAIGDQVCLF